MVTARRLDGPEPAGLSRRPQRHEPGDLGRRLAPHPPLMPWSIMVAMERPAGRIISADEIVLSPGNSRTQQDAETVIVSLVGELLGLRLRPKRIQLEDRTRVEIDGVSEDPPVLCEAWAHQGPPKAAQQNKVMTPECPT